MARMPAPPPRIALIHATPLAMEPVQAAFQRHWPQVRPMNLLDDSLSFDRAQAGRLTEAMVPWTIWRKVAPPTTTARSAPPRARWPAATP